MAQIHEGGCHCGAYTSHHARAGAQGRLPLPQLPTPHRQRVSAWALTSTKATSCCAASSAPTTPLRRERTLVEDAVLPELRQHRDVDARALSGAARARGRLVRRLRNARLAISRAARLDALQARVVHLPAGGGDFRERLAAEAGEALGIIDRGLALFRERGEFRVVRHNAESACLPILLRLLDALPRAGHEVPPDVPRAERLRRRAASRARAARASSTTSYRGPEDEQLPARKLLPVHRDLSVHDVGAALFVLGRERELRACVQPRLGVEHRRQRLHRRARPNSVPAMRRSSAPPIEVCGNSAARVVAKARRALFFVLRQRDPRLQAAHGRGPARRRRRALRVHDAAPGGHPVDVARPDRLREPRLSRCMISPSKR